LAGTPAPAPPSTSEAVQRGAITEEDLKKLLVGKPLYLRGGYLDNSLSFNEQGQLLGHSPQGSYTLCGVQIDRVRLGKRKVELAGRRYGLHFLGALPYEDPSKAVDRVNITPKKKVLRIAIDRERVITPKKKREKREGSARSRRADAVDADTLASAASPTSTALPANSEAHAASMLRDALDRIFAPGLDAQLMESLPAFWKLYYDAAGEKRDYRPSDPAVLRQNLVDRKARLLSNFEPASNEYAQAHGVAGMALYHAVIGADGKPEEIAVGRPIGFGLDENAVDAIHKATFEPALKDGKPVPVLLDLVVQFRIYSKRTAAQGALGTADKPAKPVLPGPYSAPRP
jgi:hypothetical protein